MKKDQRDEKLFVTILRKFSAIFRYLAGKYQWLNGRMREKYSARGIAGVATAAVAIITLYMYFGPNALGVADDGTLYKVMGKDGLSYMQENAADIYNNYFVKEYQLTTMPKNATLNLQDIIVRGSIFLDRLITGDSTFDLRFLAVVYLILFIPAFYILVKQTLTRIGNFAEATIVAILAVVMFGDISYTAYFDSFYHEPALYISSLYCVGAMLGVQKCPNYGALIRLCVAGAALAFTRQQTAVAGFLIAGYCMWIGLRHDKNTWKVAGICAALVLSLMSIWSFLSLESDFDQTSKFHSMTRGVLFQAMNPEKALEEMGIDPSYSVLSNASAYDYYPFVEPDAPQLDHGFYDRFTSWDVALYYVRHPGAMINMLNSAVENTVNLRRSYCSNFEQTAGRPPMAQSLYWSWWSTLKARYAPQTVSFLLILVVLGFIIYGKRDTERASLIIMFVIVGAIGLSQAGITIVMSGNAEILRHAFLLGYTVDVLFFFIIAELLSKLNVIGSNQNK